MTKNTCSLHFIAASTALLVFPIGVQGQGTLPVHCLNEGRPTCRSDSDCVDSTSAYGANSQCGNVICNVPSGTCTLEAWESNGQCKDTTYVLCSGNDGLCTKGPTGLSFVGRCDGWNKKECMYYWCPKGVGTSTTQAAGSTTAMTQTTSTTSIASTTASGTPCCTKDSDCINYPGASPLLTTCGNVQCNIATSKCVYDVWNSDLACQNDFFVWCGDSNGSSQEVKDARCNKGPTGDSGNVVGKCTLFGGNECSYTYCPGSGATTATSTTTAAITTTMAAQTTSTPMATTPSSSTTAGPGSLSVAVNLGQGIAGSAIRITGSDLGSSPGAVYWDGINCPVTSWTPTEVKAYIADTATTKVGSIQLVRADQVASIAVRFEVKAPPLVPTTAMTNAFNFIVREMRSPQGGIYTNRIDRNDLEDVYLYGHHITSEHMGLMLWVSAAMLDHEKFEESYRFVRDRMVDFTYNVVNWGVDKRTGAPFVYEPPKNLHFNAPLDDFRVVRGLISGWMQWGDDRYRELAVRIGGGLVETSVAKTVSPMYPDGLVGPGFGWQENPVSSYTEDYLVPINYADLWTMRWLSEYDSRWNPVIIETIQLMEAAQLPVGQFWNSFLKDSQTFTGDFEYQDDAQRKNKIKSIQSLWTSIHLARLGRTEAARKSFNFYKDVWYVPKGRIPEYLNPDGTETTIPDILSDGEVRIYSQLARLAYHLGETAFADQVVRERIISAQDTNPSSATFGHLSQVSPGNDSEAYETLEGMLGMAIILDSSVLTPKFPSPI